MLGVPINQLVLNGLKLVNNLLSSGVFHIA